ncbi:MAG TPA: 4-alpha-glucanotransferase, partial [Oribacterium sp.]|nr:4-alpha-glucanotransferase [Oribacterium sp.]
NPYFVDLETLIEEGLLTEEELDDPEEFDFGDDPERIDYGKLYTSKTKALKLAYTRFLAQGGDVKALAETLRPETLEYCVFMAIKDAHAGASWDVWPEALRDKEEKAVADFRATHADEIGFYVFVQYTFQQQWAALRAYATARGIEILGDIPIYCAPDSADTWAH